MKKIKTCPVLSCYKLLNKFGVVLLVFILNWPGSFYLFASEVFPFDCEIRKSVFIFQEAPFLQCHASTLVETSRGFLAAWFGGTHERHEDVCIYISAMINGQWSGPRLIADGVVNDSTRYPCWNPVLFKNNDVIYLYYKVGPDPVHWRGVYKTSNDEGKTWSEAVKLPKGILGPIKNKPIALSSGIVLSPSSVETEKTWKAHIERSEDGGENWRIVPIHSPDSIKIIQPTLLVYPGKKIQALFRSNQNRIMQSWSYDEGLSWSSPEKTGVLNPNSGIDAVTMTSGLQVLVYNSMKSGVTWEKGRNLLNLAVSKNGKEWNELLELEKSPKGEFSYPAIIQGSDGDLHITYTYNRKKIKYVKLKINQ